ncbi:phage portal protein [Sphingomonas koreensis]|uniref:Phage portal protein n=2 Tax=Sphingomonas koreensis TaxID=93064 RepID=A0A1L6J7V3_9SPHN|nr:phage portal protein [Sphingomonas koreensis]RSU22800.1 phage portal protein [Sphingomonas koreensis]RSU30726.1 phage portal protein [Sphingomonas koreensis]RSU31821.1 phage portal protein [Sphingomonas koreensis]RSU39258.1 phage portal protein [Sphingomonas koreensis]
MTGQQSAKLSGAPEDEPTRVSVETGAALASERVDERSTLGLSTAWACIGLRSELVGSMGTGVFSRVAGGGRIARPDHWLSELLHEEPNADQTPGEFWAGQVAALDLFGNAYAEKTIVGQRVAALTPLRPDQMTVHRRDSGERFYRYRDRGRVEEMPADKVFHLRGMTFGGDVGLSPIDFGRRTISTALAADRTANGLFRRGLHHSGFMETNETKLTKEQRSDLVDIFAKFTGPDSAGKIMPLERGLKFVPLEMKPEDAELLMSRRWSVEEICRWFGMLPILIGHAAQGQTMWGSGIEQLLLGWQTLRLNPLLRKIEQATKMQLLPRSERKEVYPEFNREAVMATDSAGRAALYSAFGQNGVMDRNEMRSRENLDHRPGGEFLTVQSNLVRLDKLGEAGTASSEQQLRSSLLGLLGVQDGDLEAMIAAKVKSMLGHNGGPALED